MRFLGRAVIALCYIALIIPIVFIALSIYHTIKDWLHEQA